MSLGKLPRKKRRKKEESKARRIPPNFPTSNAPQQYYTGTMEVSVPAGGSSSDYIAGSAGALAATDPLLDALPLDPMTKGIAKLGIAGAGAIKGHRDFKTKGINKANALENNANVRANTSQDNFMYQTAAPGMMMNDGGNSAFTGNPVGYAKGTQGIKKYSYGTSGVAPIQQGGGQYSTQANNPNIVPQAGAVNPNAPMEQPQIDAQGVAGAIPGALAGFGASENLQGVAGIFGNIASGFMPQSGGMAPPVMEKGGEVPTKRVEVEKGELRLKRTKNGKFKLERNYNGDGYDAHSEGGEMDDAEEGDIIIPKNRAKHVLNKVKGGNRSTKVGGQIGGNDIYDMESEISKLPKDTDIPQYADGVDEIDPTYKRGDLGAMPKFGNPQEMQDHFRENQIDPRQFSQDVGFYDTGGGFGFTEGIENKDPGFMARANAPQGSKDYGDKYSDVQEDYFRNFNDSRGAVTNPSLPATPAPTTMPPFNGNANPLPLDTSGLNVGDKTVTGNLKPSITEPSFNPNSIQDGLPTAQPASRGYNGLSHLGETLPTAYNLAQGMFGGRDTLDLGRINPDERQYRDTSERDRATANESSAVQRYNMGKRHMSRGQGIGEAANIESQRQGAHGRINQGEARRYDNIQQGNVGIRNQAQATNLGFQQQETMYDKQVMGKQSEYLGKGLEGTAGLAQNRYERDSIKSADANKFRSQERAVDFINSTYPNFKTTVSGADESAFIQGKLSREELEARYPELRKSSVRFNQPV